MDRSRMQKCVDPRVLKAQLDVVTGVARAAWFTAPLSALALAWLGSASCGLFGQQDFAVTAIYPALVGLASFGAHRVYAIYRTHAVAQAADLHRWTNYFIAVQIVVSAAWGSLPWLMWQTGSLLNHVFILLAVTAILSSLMVSRASSRVMFLAGIVPIACLTLLRFALGADLTDILLGFFAPLYVLHLYAGGRRITLRIEEDARLRFNVEDLAAELTRTRDEAVRKRYEAETANAAKTVFLANMSHELRTPLNAILGFSDIIAHQSMGRDQIDRYSDYARDIHGSGAHLLSLINDLLDVAKIESGRMEIDPRPVDTRHAVEGAARFIASRAEAKSQTVMVDIAPDVPMVVADERALKQMMLNLLSNATKFTPSGGHITISCHESLLGGIEICIADTGPGIPAEKLVKVFEPFSQLDNRFDREAGGTGLGLALVQGLARLHGGRAWLESKEGAGVRACIYLPETFAPEGQLSASA